MAFYGINDALYGTGLYGTASYGVVTPVVSLSGVSGTAAIGAPNATISATLTGVSGVGQIGATTFVNDTTATLASVVATGIVNSVTESPSEALASVSATGSIGSVFAQAWYGANDGIYGIGRYASAIYGSVTPVINAPAVVATGAIEPVSVGGFEIDISEVLVGVSATGQVNSVITIPFLVTGVSGTVQTGSAQANIAKTVSSVSATGQINTVTEHVTAGITGVVGTFTLSKGSGPFAKTFTNFAVSTVGITGSIGSVTLNILQPISGVSATGFVNTLSENPSESLASVQGTLNPLKPFTASGDAQLSTAEKKFGTASLLLDGTGDFVTTDYNSSLLASSEWAVDFWVYSSTLTSQTAHLWDGQNSNSGFALRISSGTLQVIKDGSITRSVTGQLSNDTWHHIRLQRRFAFTEVFVDGYQRGQQAGAGYNAHTYVIGAKENGSEEFTGYIDEFRASTPTGLSAASFTPETSAYSLDGSTEALLHFDGTNGSTTITNEASNVITLTLTATSNFTLTGVSATGLVNTVSENPDEVLGSVSAIGAVGSVRVLVVEKITGVSATGAIRTPTTTGVTTIFDPDNFSRARTIRLVEIQSLRRAA